MEQVYDLILLIIGIVGLCIGTELTVKKAIILTKRFNVSPMFIGLTVIAFGTDLPEVFIAINGAIHNYRGIDSSGVIMGNIIGSSISQISIIIGVTAAIRFLAAGKTQIQYLSVELIGSVILLALVAFDGVITWNDGAILIIAFLIYFLSHLNRERAQIKEVERVKEKTFLLNTTGHSAILLVGLVLVILSSELTINNAIHVAQYWGVEQSFIGAIIIGFGTSLPELAISISAAVKNQQGLTIGNLLGSNIFDLLIPVGIASLISDIRIEKQILYFDMPYLLFLSAAVIWFLSKKKGLQRKEGIGLAVIYIVYATTKYFI